MVKVLRSVLGIFAGIVVGFLTILASETISHHIFPPPPGLDIHDSKSLANAMTAMPSAAFVAILLSWTAGTFAGSFAAARIAAVGKVWHGMAIGVFFLAAGVANMLMIPHPAWVWAVGLIEPLPIAYLGAKLAAPWIAKTGPFVADL